MMPHFLQNDCIIPHTEGTYPLAARLFEVWKEDKNESSPAWVMAVSLQTRVMAKLVRFCIQWPDILEETWVVDAL